MELKSALNKSFLKSTKSSQFKTENSAADVPKFHNPERQSDKSILGSCIYVSHSKADQNHLITFNHGSIFVRASNGMKKFIFSLVIIFGLVYLSLTERKVEGILSKLKISGATRVQFASIEDSADFSEIGNADLKKVEADLAKYNLTRVSAVFISKNGTYVLTFVKTTENKIKRILFVNGQPYADDLKSISKNRIATTSGEIQTISSMTAGD